MTKLLAALALVALGATAARADGTVINVDSDGVAIDGYDTVAYFQPAGARRGSPDFQTTWQGATWYFANAENLALFEADPEAWAPQYGGWCAYALSEGEYASDTDPGEAFTVLDGRLYLNWSRRVKMRWEGEASDRLIVSEQTWPVVEQQLRDGTARISLLPED